MQLGTHALAALLSRGWLVLALALVGTPLALAEEASQPWSEAAELAGIQRQIEENGWQWEAGITEVSHVPPEERANWMGYRPADRDQWLSHASGTLEPLPLRDLPSAWDWRALGGTTGAKNQGGCGSCWAFAAVSALESIFKIENGYQQRFSEQQCLSCNTLDYGCDGGNMVGCYFLWMGFGAIDQTCMPYQASDTAPCTQEECEVKGRITGYTMVGASEELLKTAVMQQPIPVVLHAANSLFYYHGGCYENGPNYDPNHAVLLCGWDDAACGGYGAWLIKNSWGTSWGESGFGWIKYGTCSLGGDGALIHYEPFPESRLAYVAHSVLDGDNGALDPNETASISVSIRNFGTTTATGVWGVLRSATPGVTVSDSLADFGNLTTWSSGLSLGPHFTVQVAPSVARGALIEFDLELHSDQATDACVAYDFVSPAVVIYANDFETSVEGWTHGYAGSRDDWTWGSFGSLPGFIDPLQASSGSKAWGNDLTQDGSNCIYANRANNWLKSPVIDCTGRAGVHLRFKRWLSVEESTYDVAKILVNGTEVWCNPAQENLVDNSWVTMLYDLSALADNNPAVQVSFTLTSDDGLQFGGWAIDDFELIAPADLQAAVPSPEPAPVPLALTVSPNPFSPVTRLRLALPHQTPEARVEIFDAAGRAVRRLHAGPLAEGDHWFSWSGLDDAGRELPTGTYYCRARAEGQTSVAPIIRVD